MQSRRKFLGSAVAASAAAVLPTVFLPYAARAAGHGADSFATTNGKISVNPVDHASFVMQTPSLTIYNDPVGGAEKYADFPKADLILLTHHHGDHYKPDTLAGLIGEGTRMVVNKRVYEDENFTDAMRAVSTVMGNGDATMVGDINIEAIPAYNLTEDRLKYHPKGRDNGYVLMIDGFKVYIAGDTEDIPEMRALTGVDLAFVPMNLPYTMDEAAAASAVAEFKPTYVYPYHYRNSDVDVFAAAVGDASEVKRGPWY